jgi:hypothetical protein
VAFSSSGLYVLTIVDILKNDTAIDLVADSLKCAMYTDSLTPNFDTNTAYSATNEVSGTGYTAGGNVLTTVTCALGSAGQVKIDADDVSWTASTITNARGAIIYDDTITTPTADPLLIAIAFGADYSTTAGTFGIAWSASGIAVIDVTP